MFRTLRVALIIFIILLIPNITNAQSALALSEKAFQLYQEKDYTTAEKFLRMSLALDPNNALAHYYLAETLAKQQRSPAEILEHYRQAASLSPDSEKGTRCTC